jgi:uncharacterized protein
MHIEVVYAPDAQQQSLIALDAPEDCSVQDAIELSKVLLRHPEIDLQHHKTGIFGHLTTLDHPLQAGDRVEIYRPLKQNPMSARRQRATRR